MLHTEVYKFLIEIAEKSHMSVLSVDSFIVQKDAYQRVADDDSVDEAFLSYLYTGGLHDNDLAFELIMTREGFAIGGDSVFIGADYKDFDTPKLAAKAIFESCIMFLNGQIRLVITMKGNMAAYIEEFIVYGSIQEPLQVIPLRKTLTSFFLHRNVQAYMLRNAVLEQQLPINEYPFLQHKPLQEAYHSLHRVIEWDDPMPLLDRDWNKIITEVTWHETGKRPLQSPYLYALKQWETWVFTLIFGAIFISLALLLPQLHALIQGVSQICFIIFVISILPKIARRKYAKKNHTQ